MLKNIFGIILGLLGMLFIFSASSGSYYMFRTSHVKAILGILGLLLLYGGVKLIDFKSFDNKTWMNSKWAKYSISTNQAIILLILFVVLVFVLLLFFAYLVAEMP